MGTPQQQTLWTELQKNFNFYVLLQSTLYMHLRAQWKADVRNNFQNVFCNIYLWWIGIQSLYVEKAKNMGIAVLGTMLQRPFSFPERQFSLIFLHSAKLKTEEESQIYCSEMRRLYLHKIPERLTTTVYQNITRVHRKSRQNTKTWKDRSFFCLAEINMHHGWPLVTPGKVSCYPLGWIRCVSHSRSACGGQENIF
jgi:hypothetical protein